MRSELAEGRARRDRGSEIRFLDGIAKPAEAMSFAGFRLFSTVALAAVFVLGLVAGDQATARCVPIGGGKLKIRPAAGNVHSRFSWKAKDKSLDFLIADPTSGTTTVQMLVAGTVAATIAFDQTAAAAWRSSGNPVRAWGYKDRDDPSPIDGIEKIKSKEHSFQLKGKDGIIDLLTAPLALPISIQVTDSAGACYVSHFTECARNDDRLIKCKQTPQSAMCDLPQCAINDPDYPGYTSPQASLRFENLTRDRDAANWIRLDARGSEDRDGTIASYEYAISSRSDGRSLEAPGQTMSPVAHVELSPGDYEDRVTVTDDQGQRGTQVRNLSISGAPIAQFGRLGVRWALSESWRLGDPAPVFRVSHAVIPLAEIGEIFTTPAEAPRESNSKRGLETTASSSGNKCGSSMKKEGFFINMATGVVAIGAGMVLGPEATVAIKVGSTAATSAGSTLSYKGGEATTSCLQNQINNLSDEVLFQSQQIAQIQNQLDLTDAAFFTAWTQVLNSQNATFFDAYRQSFNQFSPNPYGTGGSIPSPAQSCQEATPNGPESTCALASGGIFGGFMENAGLWCSEVGQPIPNLCNTPGPQAVATSCSAAYDCSEADSSAPGPYLLQTE
ncbi:MAG: hypothetical protein H8E96_07625, partial [Verrucomicrobiaceae bacterium]|nr:hypothetical protein [Verrucomicrobiaceae bacterium]